MFKVFVIGMVKVGLFICILSLLVVFSFALVQAEEALSTHNEEQAAKQAAMDRLYDAGCIRTHMRRTGSFSVFGKTMGQMDIVGYTVTIECVRWGGGDPPPPSSVEVYVFTWLPPETREDGAPLLSEEISGYNVYVNSEVTATTKLPRWEYTPSEHMPLPITVEVTAIDTDGNESNKTESIGVP